MIQILQYLTSQDPGNNGNIVYVMSCKIYFINSMFGNQLSEKHQNTSVSVSRTSISFCSRVRNPVAQGLETMVSARQTFANSQHVAQKPSDVGGGLV